MDVFVQGMKEEDKKRGGVIFRGICQSMTFNNNDNNKGTSLKKNDNLQGRREACERPPSRRRGGRCSPHPRSRASRVCAAVFILFFVFCFFEKINVHNFCLFPSPFNQQVASSTQQHTTTTWLESDVMFLVFVYDTCTEL